VVAPRPGIRFRAATVAGALDLLLQPHAPHPTSTPNPLSLDSFPVSYPTTRRSHLFRPVVFCLLPPLFHLLTLQKSPHV
jgi:hypothetical protein